jgi:hypothetical protein
MWPFRENNLSDAAEDDAPSIIVIMASPESQPRADRHQVEEQCVTATVMACPKPSMVRAWTNFASLLTLAATKPSNAVKKMQQTKTHPSIRHWINSIIEKN